MADFINTVDKYGDEATMDMIINRTIDEYCDDAIEIIGPGAFCDCAALVKLDLPNLKTVTGNRWLGKTFENCTSLESVSMPNLEKVAGFSMFAGCSKLKRIDFPNLTLMGAIMFKRAQITEAVFPKVTGSATGSGLDNVFSDCSNLEKIDFHVLTSIGNLGNYLRALKALIIRTPTICTLGTTWWLTVCPIGDSTNAGYIYVPRALLSDDDETKDYRRATNWSTVAAQFRALEDYTVDGTVTGELDETKI